MRIKINGVGNNFCRKVNIVYGVSVGLDVLYTSSAL